METERPTETENSTKTGTEHLKDFQWKPGQSGNPGGRPKGTMKEYLSRKFYSMSDEDKEKFLQEHKVTGKDMIEFGEGKAKQDVDIDATITGPSLIRLDE